MACDTGLDFLSGAGEDSHISASISDPRYGALLLHFYPTAPLNPSVVLAGGRKIKNAPSVSSQDGPLAKGKEGCDPVTTFLLYLPSQALEAVSTL